MPDKKLSDNEIIKALECCVSEQYTCEQCPYQEIKHYDYDNGFEIMPNGKQYDDWSCERWLNTDLLDLINRQKAEIEALKDQEQRAHNYCKSVCEPKYKAEIERLEKDRKENFEMWKKLCKQAEEKHEKMFQEAKATIRPKAIKEFAERLKEYREIVSYDRDFDAYVYGSHIHIDIDEFENLVKEIAGEQ